MILNVQHLPGGVLLLTVMLRGHVHVIQCNGPRQLFVELIRRSDDPQLDFTMLDAFGIVYFLGEEMRRERAIGV